MKTFSFSTLLLAMLFLGSVSAEAANRYVRAGASGSANGIDWTNAFTTLPSVLTRGDTYYIADGSYEGYTFDDAESGTTVTTVQKATTTDHGTNTGWDNSYGDGQATFSSKIEFVSSYWVFDGVTGGGPQNNWNQRFGFKITETSDENAVIRVAWTGRADHISIRHVDIKGKGSASTSGGSHSNDGLAVYGASNVTLSYFWMHGIGRCPFYISPQDFIAEFGWVESFYGSSTVHSEVASIWSFGKNGPVGDTTFRYNLITDLQSTGGLMWDNAANKSAHLYVYGNIFYKPDGATWGKANGVIGGWTGGNGQQFHNAHVYNNTFINIDQQTLSVFPLVFSGNVVYNNLWYNCQPPIFLRFTTHDYNHFINSGDTQSERHGSSATSGNPFVDYPHLNFALTTATTAGIALPAPFHLSPMGTIRGADGTWDRGAFEFVNGLYVTPPLTPKALRVQ